MRTTELHFLEFSPALANSPVLMPRVKQLLGSVAGIKNKLYEIQTEECTHPNGSVHLADRGLHQCTTCGYTSPRRF